MIIYLSGKITGDWDYKEKFRKKESVLICAGHAVLNPAKLPEGMPREKYMPICLAMLDSADAIYMIGDWQESEGARIEYKYAIYQGKAAYFEKPMELKELEEIKNDREH